MIEFLILFAILMFLGSIPVGSAKSISYSEYMSQKKNEPHLWFGITSNGDCYIDIRKFIVYSAIDKTPDDWRQEEPFNAVAAVIKKNGEIQYTHFTARLCENETLYYITTDEYNRICMHGRLLGMVMPLPDYKKINKEVFQKGKYDLADKSQFMYFGYTVNAKDSFSAKYRQSILMFMIESGLVSKYEAINFLDFNISYHIHNPNNRLAVSKWEADRMFLSNYTFGSVDVNWVTTSNPPDVEAINTSPKYSNTDSPTNNVIAEKPQQKFSNNYSTGKSINTEKYVNKKPDQILATRAAISGHSVGEKVKHKVFGRGIVTRIDADDNLILIDFGEGNKRFTLDRIDEFLLQQ